MKLHYFTNFDSEKKMSLSYSPFLRNKGCNEIKALVTDDLSDTGLRLDF